MPYSPATHSGRYHSVTCGTGRARSEAAHHPDPLGPEELPNLAIEISVLSSLKAATAEEVRAAVEAADFHGVRVTVSIGVAAWRSGRIEVSQALDLADRALYEAKRGGRNRVAASRGGSGVGKAA